MVFSDLFLGGPTILERGFALCAVNHVDLGLSDLEVKRLRWTIPLASFLMCIDTLPDNPAGRSLRTMCDINFNAWLSSRDAIAVRVGDYVVAAEELRMLRSTKKIQVGFFSDVRDARLTLGVLTAHVLEFRIGGMKPILDDCRAARFAAPNPALEFDRIDVLAHAVGCLVFGRELEESSSTKLFLIDVLAETQKAIDEICAKFTG